MAYLKNSRSSIGPKLFLVILLAAVGLVIVLAVRAGGTESIDTMDSTSGWTASSPLATIAADSGSKKEGAASLRLRTPETSVFNKTIAAPKDMSAATQIKFWSRLTPILPTVTSAASGVSSQDTAGGIKTASVDDGTQVFEVRLGTDTNNYYKKTFVLSSSAWQESVTARTNWTAVGTAANWANITKLVIVSSEPLDINLDSFRFVNADAVVVEPPEPPEPPTPPSPTPIPTAGGTTSATTTSGTTTKSTTSTKTTSKTASSTTPTPATGEVSGASTNAKPKTDATTWIYGSALAGVLLLGLGSHLGWTQQASVWIKPMRKEWLKLLKRFR